MQKKAFIYDFDNTIFPVPSIGDKLFAPLFSLIEDDGGYTGDFASIKDAVMRQPFQAISTKHNFSKQLTDKSVTLLNELAYDGPLAPFEDYEEIKKLPGDRYLVTTGFYKLQKSKIDASGVKDNFREIHIIDPATTDKTKKDLFKEILQANGYQPHEVVVIGDDPESEIKAGNELNIETVLYDKYHRYPKTTATHLIDNFKQLVNIFRQPLVK
ncbi:MAG: HAD family hydrolase [Chitinophagaceae bacterium]|nr:HAD family hydrolase [Chitinophagaceae bacterium]